VTFHSAFSLEEWCFSFISFDIPFEFCEHDVSASYVAHYGSQYCTHRFQNRDKRRTGLNPICLRQLSLNLQPARWFFFQSFVSFSWEKSPRNRSGTSRLWSIKEAENLQRTWNCNTKRCNVRPTEQTPSRCAREPHICATAGRQEGPRAWVVGSKLFLRNSDLSQHTIRRRPHRVTRDFKELNTVSTTEIFFAPWPTNAQLFTLLHVSTVSCHPQGACNQYLAKLHKYSKCSCW